MDSKQVEVRIILCRKVAEELYSWS